MNARLCIRVYYCKVNIKPDKVGMETSVLVFKRLGTEVVAGS